jgi:hypothetical protein
MLWLARATESDWPTTVSLALLWPILPAWLGSGTRCALKTRIRAADEEDTNLPLVVSQTGTSITTNSWQATTLLDVKSIVSCQCILDHYQRP